MILDGYMYNATLLGEGEFRLSLKGDCPVYAAHFPGMPVTPGVCIMQIVKELAEKLFSCRLDVRKVKNIKFLSLLTPEACPVVKFDKLQKCEDGTLAVQARLLGDSETVYATVSLICSLNGSC